MSTDLLNAVPNVEIDPQGTFKYVLIRVYAPQTPDGSEPSKMIVRGNRRGAYHGEKCLKLLRVRSIEFGNAVCM